MNLFRNKTQQ